MNTSAEILFVLLRMALGGDATRSERLDLGSVSAKVWKEVVDLSFDQGVAAIAVDGLQKSLALDPEYTKGNSERLGLALDSPELEDLKYEWFGDVFVCEEDYQNQSAIIRYLTGLWQDVGLNTFALKGVAFARYYPVPEHRHSVDFDCNVRSADGAPAWAVADRVARTNGIEVDDSMNKHSRYVVREVSVENHRNVIAVNGSRRNRRFDVYLQGLLLPEERLFDGVLPDMALYSPCWLFDALFCVVHARAHFLLEEGITLKHVLDWVMIRRSPEAARWREQFEIDIDRFGLRKFFDALDAVADCVMGVSIELTGPQRLMLDDIFAPKAVRHFKNRFLAHLNILRMLWMNRWKFPLYSETSLFATVCQYVYGHWFDRDN